MNNNNLTKYKSLYTAFKEANEKSVNMIESIIDRWQNIIPLIINKCDNKNVKEELQFMWSDLLKVPPDLIKEQKQILNSPLGEALKMMDDLLIKVEQTTGKKMVFSEDKNDKQ